MISNNRVTNTSNQSTNNISFKHIFLFDNLYSEGIFNNNTGSDYDLVPGLVVIRDVDNPTKLIPAVAGATLAYIVGVISTNETITGIADGSDENITFCHGGTVNGGHLILPDGVTFDTLIPETNITVGDKLRALGLEIEEIIENTKFDN